MKGRIAFSITRALVFLILEGTAGCSKPIKPPPDPSPETQTTYEAAMAQRGQLESQLKSLTWGNPSDLPGSGSASFQGVMFFSTQIDAENSNFVGQLEMTAQWATNSVSGVAEKWVDEQNATFGGQLQFANVVIDRTVQPDLGYVFSGDVTGVLAKGPTELAIDAQLFGDFLGSNAFGANGGISGTAQSGSNTTYLGGGFLAVQ